MTDFSSWLGSYAPVPASHHQQVLEFLDLSGSRLDSTQGGADKTKGWDPSLMFVLGAGCCVSFLAHAHVMPDHMISAVVAKHKVQPMFAWCCPVDTAPSEWMQVLSCQGVVAFNYAPLSRRGVSFIGSSGTRRPRSCVPPPTTTAARAAACSAPPPTGRTRSWCLAGCYSGSAGRSRGAARVPCSPPWSWSSRSRPRAAAATPFSSSARAPACGSQTRAPTFGAFKKFFSLPLLIPFCF